MKSNGMIENRRLIPSPNPHIRLEEIVYWSNGIKVKGLLAEPRAAGRYEGIVYLRGGIQSIGMVRPSRIAQIAAEGFVVFAPYYRGNRGGQGRDTFSGEDRLDAVYAVDVLKQSASVHPERLHLLSFSRGGIMALWVAVLRDDLTSIVQWAGVSDIVLTYKERKDMRRMMKRVIGGSTNSYPKGYRERNVLQRIEEIRVPVLIVHGMKDQHVSFAHAKILEEALLAAKKQVDTWYYPMFHHYIPQPANRELVTAIGRWMYAQKDPPTDEV